MSADLDKIYEVCVENGTRLTKIETKQEERHSQNQVDMKKLHKLVAIVATLKAHVFFQWFFIGGIFIGIVTLFIKNV